MAQKDIPWLGLKARGLEAYQAPLLIDPLALPDVMACPWLEDRWKPASWLL
jgi:hypothetical protein